MARRVECYSAHLWWFAHQSYGGAGLPPQGIECVPDRVALWVGRADEVAREIIRGCRRLTVFGFADPLSQGVQDIGFAPARSSNADSISLSVVLIRSRSR